jgi:GNAT superfamily N-acetyltransferase
MSSLAIQILPASPADVPAILAFIRELAEFEKLLHHVEATETQLHAALFAPHPVAEALTAHGPDGPCGFALFFTNFSTFLARPGLYLEDLYVRPSYRGRNVGRALIQAVAQRACARGYRRMDWAVLDWNERAIAFYQQIGARPLHDWTTQRLEGEALQAFAARA